MRRVRGHLGQQEQHLEGAFNARDAFQGMYEADQYRDFSATQRQDLNELNIFQKCYNLLSIAP